MDDVLAFYQQVPGLVEERFAEIVDVHPVELDGEPPAIELGKAVGDELIFSCVIRACSRHR